MSSSAFTPSTTTVTNEVPVNVPVVTKFEDSTTPSGGWFVTGPTNVTTTVKQARIGTEAHLKYAVIATGSSAAFSELSINLPANLTVDTTAINRTSSGRAPIGRFELTKPGVGNYTGVVYYEGSSFVCRYLGSTAIPSSVGNTSPINWDTTTSATSINIDIIIPISQWAGSGTTTLATRAVEEYAYNTDTSADNSPTQFGYGPDGVLFPNVTAAGIVYAKRVRFQTPILSTDSIIVEYQQAGSGPWRSVANRMPYTAAGAATYGIQVVNVSTTDVDVNFHAQGAAQTGATYGSPGELWSAYHGAGWKWRVRKISSGAQVGYPVSARNIVGDTSGSVVPVGMLGQIISGASDAGTLVAGSNTDKTVTTITLPAGNWLIFGQVYFDPGGTTTSRLHSSISTGTSSLTGTILNILGLDVVEGYANLSGGFVNANYNFPVNVLATTTYNINVRVIYTGTPISSSPLRTVIRAIRIA